MAPGSLENLGVAAGASTVLFPASSLAKTKCGQREQRAEGLATAPPETARLSSEPQKQLARLSLARACGDRVTWARMFVCVDASGRHTAKHESLPASVTVMLGHDPGYFCANVIIVSLGVRGKGVGGNQRRGEG